MYSIIVAAGCAQPINSEDQDIFSRDHAVIKIEKDHDFIVEDRYCELRDLQDAFGISLNDLEPGIYRIQFNLDTQRGNECAINVRTQPVTYPQCESLIN